MKEGRSPKKYMLYDSIYIKFLNIYINLWQQKTAGELTKENNKALEVINPILIVVMASQV
jgi:hypothetical protein